MLALLCGDCLDLIPTLEDDSGGLVGTSQFLRGRTIDLWRDLSTVPGMNTIAGRLARVPGTS